MSPDRHRLRMAVLIMVWSGAALLAACGCSTRSLPLEPSRAFRGAAPLSGRPNGQEVSVTLAPEADAAAVAATYGASLHGSASWRCAKMLPAADQSAEELAAMLAADPRVLSAEPGVPAECAEARQQSFSFDDGWGSAEACLVQPSALTLGLDEAHAIGRGAGVRVAILDTGIDRTHPALAGSIVGGWDFVDEDPDPTDSADGIDDDGDGVVDEALGHGTHVAGIVHLTAPGAELLVARVLSSEGHGDMIDVARAIRWAVAHGARVINLSLGSLTRSDAVQLALAEAADVGVVCVAAAGNSGSNTPVEFPASSRFTVAVAALDVQGLPAAFTSYGDFVEISAPGTAIRSTFTGGGYALWSGTSMAAPFVSGGFALLIPLHPEWSEKRLEDRLRATARTIDLYQGLLGAGALDLGAALRPDSSSDESQDHNPLRGG